MAIETVKELNPLAGVTPAPKRFDPARQAVFNGCVSLAKGLSTVLVTVALTPFLIRHLGSTDFGLWSLLGLFIAYVQLIDLGTSGATAKFIGEISPKQNAGQLKTLFTSFMVIVVALACGALVLALLFRGVIESKLSVIGLVGPEAKLFLVGVTGLYAIGLIPNGLASVLLGLHRYDVANYVALSVLFVQTIGTVVVLRLGLGLEGLIYLTGATAALSIGAYFYAVRSVMGEVKFHWRDASFRTASKVLRLGSNLQAYALVGVFYFYVGKAVISFWFPLATVAAYEVALRLPILFRQGILTVLGPLLPAVSHLDAHGQTAHVRDMMAQAFRYSLIIGMPAFVGVAVLAGPIVRLWVGNGFAESITPLRIISIAIGFSVFPDLAWFFLVGLGKQRLAVVSSVGVVLFGTLFSCWMAIKLGLIGVALAMLVTSLLATSIFVVILVRDKVISISELPIALGIKVTLVAAGLYLLALSILSRFPATYFNLGFAALMAGVIYLTWLVKGGILKTEERSFLRNHIPTPLHFLC